MDLFLFKVFGVRFILVGKIIIMSALMMKILHIKQQRRWVAAVKGGSRNFT